MLAREAQADRWAALVDVAPFPENVADDICTSPYCERLEASLARHEAAGHVVTVALTALAPRLTPGDERTDSAAQLASMLHQATSELPPSKNRRARVAGLIATPAEPIASDIEVALGDRQTLIETAAWQLARDAQEARAEWVIRLGKPPTQPRSREQWLAHAATIALYRHRHDITGQTTLGDPKGIKSAEQAAEYRVVRAALWSARAISASADGTPLRRDTRKVDQTR